MAYSTEENKSYLRARYVEQRKEMLDYLGGKCVDCGSTESLEIDHVDWRTKSFTVGGLYGLSRLPEVYAEMDKCQLLCRECHAEKTKQDLAEQRKENPSHATFTHGTLYAWMKVKCRCEPCDVARRSWYDARNTARRTDDGNKREKYGRPSDHGEILHYRRGCRCTLRRAANAAYAKTLKN